MLGELGHVGVFGEVLTQRSVGVLIGSTLPRRLWVTEIDLDAGVDAELDVLGHFSALIPCQRLPQVLGEPLNRFGQGDPDGLGGVAVREREQHHITGPTFHQSSNGGLAGFGGTLLLLFAVPTWMGAGNIQVPDFIERILAVPVVVTALAPLYLFINGFFPKWSKQNLSKGGQGRLATRFEKAAVRLSEHPVFLWWSYVGYVLVLTSTTDSTLVRPDSRLVPPSCK